MTQQIIYKYTSLDTAKKIMNNRSFRFSSPSAFNDPYDMHIGSIYGYDKNLFAIDYVNAFISEIAKIGLSKSLPDDVKQLREVILKIGEHSTGKEQFATKLVEKGGLFEIEENLYHALIKPICNSYGVFCASLKPDNLLMWSHYSNNHQGIVFEISPSINSIYSNGELVNYSDERSTLFKTPEVMIERQCIVTDIEFNEFASKLMKEITYSKSSQWKYEEEYRLAIPEMVRNGKLFKDVQIATNEITAIYVGCNMSQMNIANIVSKATKFNPYMNIFIGRRHNNSYELEFDRQT